MTFIEKRYPEWVKKYGVEMADRLRQKSADILGEDAVLDKAEDVLMAISVVAAHAHAMADQWGQEWNSDFCPNCGAKMEGGEEE